MAAIAARTAQLGDLTAAEQKTRYLCVVARENRQLYSILTRHFADRRDVEIVWDRRGGQLSLLEPGDPAQGRIERRARRLVTAVSLSLRGYAVVPRDPTAA